MSYDLLMDEMDLQCEDNDTQYANLFGSKYANEQDQKTHDEVVAQYMPELTAAGDDCDALRTFTLKMDALIEDANRKIAAGDSGQVLNRYIWGFTDLRQAAAAKIGTLDCVKTADDAAVQQSQQQITQALADATILPQGLTPSNLSATSNITGYIAIGAGALLVLGITIYILKHRKK